MAALAAALLLAGCASAPEERRTAHIEIQEGVGFTITEQARVNADVQESYEAAVLLLEQGHLAEGIRGLEAVAAGAPDSSAPHIDLGIAYHQRGDLGLAEESLVRALALNPEQPVALNELGIVYRKTGRFADARRSYEAALAVYPGYHYARRNLAVLCDLYLADTACALANYDAYQAAAPDDAEAAMWSTDLRNRTGRQ